MAGYLDDLLGHSEQLIRDHTKKVTGSTSAVVYDLFDNEVYNELIVEVPALEDLHAELDRNYAYTDGLLRDILQFFWQSDPLLRGQEEMAPTHLRNHAVAMAIAEAPETPRTRQYTRLDRYAATMAVLAIGERIKGLIDQYNDEIEKAEEQQQQAQQKLDQLMNKLADLLKQLELAGGMPGMGNPGSSPIEGDDDNGEVDGESGDAGCTQGPLTEEQQSLVNDLMDLLNQISGTMQELEDADGAVDNENHRFDVTLRLPVRKAVKEAAEELQEEAEKLALWGIEPGHYTRLNWEERAKLARRLDTNKMAQFAKLIGRFRAMSAAEHSKKTVYGRDEMIGTTVTDDPRDFLDEEWGNLVHPDLKVDFLARFAESQVLSHHYRGQERVARGACVELIDNSGSMHIRDKHGITREAWAKAFSFALLDECRRTNRDFIGINFGSNSRELHAHRFPKGVGTIDAVLDFIEEFFGGGTNFMIPLDYAANLIEEEYNQIGSLQGDIILVSDGDCDVTAAWLERFLDRRTQLDFRTWGIAIGQRSTSAMEKLCSPRSREIYEFADPDVVADIIRSL